MSSAVALRMVSPGPLVQQCRACCEDRDSPAPLDVGSRRSWATDRGIEMCWWCAEVERIISGATSEARALAAIRHSTVEWRLLLRCFFFLKLEGAREVDAVGLNARYGVLSKIFLADELEPARSSRSETSAASSSQVSMCATTSASTTTTSPRIVKSGYKTPKKVKAEACDGAEDDASPSRLLVVKQDQASPKRLGQSAKKRGPPNTPSVPDDDAADSDFHPDMMYDLPNGDSDDDRRGGRGGAGPVGPDDEHEVGLPLLSFEGRFPNCHAGVCIQRMRTTVNEYCQRARFPYWNVNFKNATVRALERRMMGHEDEVNRSLHINMAAAYKSLRIRIRAMCNLFKAMCAWQSSQQEKHLKTAKRNLDHIKLVLDFFGVSFGPDLIIFRAQANFQQVFSQTQSVDQASLGHHVAYFLVLPRPMSRGG